MSTISRCVLVFRGKLLVDAGGSRNSQWQWLKLWFLLEVDPNAMLALLPWSWVGGFANSDSAQIVMVARQTRNRAVAVTGASVLIVLGNGLIVVTVAAMLISDMHRIRLDSCPGFP